MKDRKSMWGWAVLVHYRPCKSADVHTELSNPKVLEVRRIQINKIELDFLNSATLFRPDPNILGKG